MVSFYEQRMLRLFERYELSDNMRTLFKALEDSKTSRLDEAGLRRLVRLSPANRSAIVKTMVKCAVVMNDTPKEAKYCLAIITGCAEMLEIADKTVEEFGFPSFTKLPAEIRNRIYDMYLGNIHDAPPIIPYPKKGNCYCAPHEPPAFTKYPRVDIQLALTSRQVSNEVLTCFYSRRKFYFPCACEMDHFLANNALFKSTITDAMFHWCGERADKGIRQLREIRQLHKITVVVSKATSRSLSSREKEIRRFFTPKRTATTTLCQCLGWEELLDIRGLNEVKVEHVNKRTSDRRTDEERQSLENMLISRVLRPRTPEET